MQKGLAQLRELTFFPRCMIKEKGLTNEELSYFKKKTQLCDRFIDERERERSLYQTPHLRTTTLARAQ